MVGHWTFSDQVTFIRTILDLVGQNVLAKIVLKYLKLHDFYDKLHKCLIKTWKDLIAFTEDFQIFATRL